MIEKVNIYIHVRSAIAAFVISYAIAEGYSSCRVSSAATVLELRC